MASENCKERKKIVQAGFEDKIGLIVDILKQRSGTINNGNMARQFFANPKIFSKFIRIDRTLINRFAVILKTISSGFAIEQKFDEYCYETVGCMSICMTGTSCHSVHKLLGAIIICINFISNWASL